jgi:hypothetical protein
MRYAMLLALAWAAACQPRRPPPAARAGGPPALAGLGARDSSADPAAPVPPVVRAPSVVVFWLRAADTLSEDDRAQALADLRYYTAQVAPALAANGIALLATNADTVYIALPGDVRRPVLLAGLDYPYGYVLVDPGGPERILTGVYADDELLDELRAYFDLPDDSTAAPPRITT